MSEVISPASQWMRPLFSLADAERCFQEWGSNCGPAAVAAICHMRLDDVRPYLGDFESKRYTNPTLMFEILRRLEVRNRCETQKPGRAAPFWPGYGLARIQWGGPWMDPKANQKWRYRQTHWVGACIRGDSVGIFDINAMSEENPMGWCKLKDWEDILVPYIVSNIPRATIDWSITHSIEVTL
jgi:hypothetical protein